jgi:hypothetical protein
VGKFIRFENDGKSLIQVKNSGPNKFTLAWLFNTESETSFERLEKDVCSNAHCTVTPFKGNITIGPFNPKMYNREDGFIYIQVMEDGFIPNISIEVFKIENNSIEVRAFETVVFLPED